MIDQPTIDRILDAAQIVDVVSEFVTLRKRGVNFVGLCPFHDDKTPSFYVSPAKGLCKCFACGKGGNAVHFVMEHEQMTYPEALRWLAKKYNIEIKERELTDEEKQVQNIRESLFVVNEFAKLPGVGRKTAMRLVLHLLRQDTAVVEAFGNAIVTLKHEVKYCKVCHNISDTETCRICSSPQRDASVVCVVENIRDVMAVEATQQFRGLYHVLGGVISPMDGIGPGDLQIESLVRRVAAGGINEVILALSTTMEGDTTNFYIYRKLEKLGVKLSVIARGISIGDELEYTDEVTLGRSIVNRTPFSGTA